MTTPSNRPWLRIGIAAAVLVVAGLAVTVVFLIRASSQPPAPPAVDLAGADPALAAAVGDAQQRVRESPQSAKAWGRLAMLLLANDLSAAAQVCLARAEVLDPHDPRWPYFQAGINRWTNPDAGDKLRRAVELCDDHPPTPRLRLAEWLLSRGRLEEADAEFNRSLAAVPANPWARLGLARAALGRDDAQATLARLNEAPDPKTSVREVLPHAYHDVRAAIYQRLGDTQAAADEAVALRASPEDPEPPDPYADELEPFAVGLQSRIQLADRQRKAGRAGEALQVLQDLARDYPDADVVWLRLMQTLQTRGDVEGAERAARHAVQLAPTSIEGQHFLGLILLQEGRPADAAACFRRATELDPAFAPGYLSLGQCLDKQGDRPGAIAALRSAVRYAPQVAAAHRELGERLAQAGQKEEAAAELRDTVRLDPDDVKARELLEKLDRPVPSPK